MADRWDLEVVRALGLDAGLLAPILPSAGALAGHLTTAAATELGLPAGIPVAAGAGDTAAAALGSGIADGDVQLTVGTGAQVIRPLITPVSRADAGINLYRSATPSGWYHMGATVSAGLSLNWVRETMNATWEELYASASMPDQPGQGPIFVPHLAGERAPYSDPALRGSWTGLSLADDRASLLRSALEGAAFAIRDALVALLGEQRPPYLRLAGGGTLATGWRQLLADVLGLPLCAVDVPAASGRGAAFLGAVAAGMLSFDDIRGPLAPPASLVAQPDPAMNAYHAERHDRFRRLVSTLGGLPACAEGTP